MSRHGHGWRRRRCQAGISIVELLVAGLLLSMGLAACVKLWMFSYLVTTDTDKVGISYNLGRQALEQVRASGFTGASEGATIAYYSGAPALVGSSTGAAYKVTTTIVSTAVSSGTAGSTGAVPSSSALRTVNVSVQDVSNTTTLYSTHTYLTRGGI